MKTIIPEPEPALKVECSVDSVSQICFICINSATSDRRFQGEEDEWGSEDIKKKSCSRILTSYLLLQNLQYSSSGENTGRSDLQAEILSCFENKELSICSECLSKAEKLRSLHMELEKIQMEILSVLKNLQDYLVMQNLFRGGDADSILEELKNGDEITKGVLSLFQAFLRDKFLYRDLSDGTHVRLERLENVRHGRSGWLPPESTQTERNERNIYLGFTIPHPTYSDGGCGSNDKVDYGQDVDDDVDQENVPLGQRLKTKNRKTEWLLFEKEKVTVHESKPVYGSNPSVDNSDSDESSSTGPPSFCQYESDDSYNPEDSEPEELGIENKRRTTRSKVIKGSFKPLMLPNRPISQPHKKAPLLWECDICFENIPFKQHEAHLKTHPEFEKYYKCPTCPHIVRVRYFGTYKGLVWHYMRKSKKHRVPMPCELCPDQSSMFEFENKKELCKHLYEFHHPNHKKLQCGTDNCSEEFCDPMSLQLHRNQFHPESGETYSCEVCQETFSSWRTKRIHMRDEKHLLQCAFCSKEFIDPKVLQTHEKKHESGWEPKYSKMLVQCDQCPKMIRHSQLPNHIKIVHGERNLCCIHCGKAFSNPSTLKVHENSHTVTERKFKCSQCSYAGRTKTRLRLHMRRHGEKTFQCQYCPKAFPVKDYLRNHLRTHTKEKPYQCKICGKPFVSSTSRRRHYRNIHGITPGQHSFPSVGETWGEQEQLDQNKMLNAFEKVEMNQ